MTFLFSGTVFYRNGSGAVQVGPISWDQEARYRLPVESWRAVIDTFYPNSAWLCLPRDIFEKLHKYKIEGQIPTWEQVFEELLASQGQGVRW